MKKGQLVDPISAILSIILSIIQTIVHIILGFWNNSPAILKFLIFISLVSTFIFTFQQIYDFNGYLPSKDFCPLCYYKPAWDHRVFLPKDCIDAQVALQNTTPPLPFQSIVILGYLQNNPFIVTDYLQDYISNNIAFNATDCFKMADCVNMYAYGHNSSCSCSCIDGGIAGWALTCQENNEFGMPVISVCNMNVLNTSIRTTTLNSYCKYVFTYAPSEQESVVNASALLNSPHCKNAGFDYLNSTLIWGGTILIYCIIGLYKVAELIGIFK